MKITTDIIQKLRAQTGAGMMDCKSFLEKADGDLDKAIELFKKEGREVAKKKQDRSAEQGLVDAYIHPGNKVGVLLEVNCETDFVARNEEFKDFVHDLAMHIAAFDPTDIDGKEDSLLKQPFLKDEKKTVEEYLNEKISSLGENIKIKKFTRYAL